MKETGFTVKIRDIEILCEKDGYLKTIKSLYNNQITQDLYQLLLDMDRDLAIIVKDKLNMDTLLKVFSNRINESISVEVDKVLVVGLINGLLACYPIIDVESGLGVKYNELGVASIEL